MTKKNEYREVVFACGWKWWIPHQLMEMFDASADQHPMWSFQKYLNAFEDFLFFNIFLHFSLSIFHKIFTHS